MIHLWVWFLHVLWLLWLTGDYQVWYLLDVSPSYGILSGDIVEGFSALVWARVLPSLLSSSSSSHQLCSLRLYIILIKDSSALEDHACCQRSLREGSKWAKGFIMLLFIPPFAFFFFSVSCSVYLACSGQHIRDLLPSSSVTVSSFIFPSLHLSLSLHCKTRAMELGAVSMPAVGEAHQSHLRAQDVLRVFLEIEMKRKGDCGKY